MTTRRYLITFSIVLALGAVLAIYAASRLTDVRHYPSAFSNLSGDQLFVVNGLTRKQMGEIKIGHIENNESPRVALMGNHQFMMFGSEAFGPETPADYFFNFWYANLTLPELRDLLIYMEKLDKLPGDVILIQMTTPNNDNGHHIVNYNGELPSDVIERAATVAPVDRLYRLILDTDFRIRRTFDYSGFLFGLFASNMDNRVFDPAECQNSATGLGGLRRKIIERLPLSIRLNMSSLLDKTAFCDRRLWANSLRFDGSVSTAYAPVAQPKLNAGSKDPTQAGLSVGDSERIAGFMQEIDDLGRRKGKAVIFVIPPVYESEHESALNGIVDNALARTKGLTVIDHRRLTLPAQYFHTFDHPTVPYFRLLVDELRRTGKL